MENLDVMVLRSLRDWRAGGQRALLATVVRTWGSSPRPVGSIMALCEDGAVVGMFMAAGLEFFISTSFSKSFSLADEVWIVPVYGARETYQQELLEISSRLAEMIAAQGVAARFCGSLDQTRASLDDTLRPGDVLLTLGAGDIDRIHHAFTRRLQ